MLKRDVSPWGEGNFSSGRLRSGSSGETVVRTAPTFSVVIATPVATSKSQVYRGFSPFFTSKHASFHTYTQQMCHSADGTEKPHDWCRSGTNLPASDAMQISQSVISRPVIPMDEMMNSGRKVESSAWSEEPLLRWVGVCGGEMLINYSVWLCWDEKHSNQIHRRRGILQKDGPCSWLAWRWSRACQLRERKKASHSLFWREMTKKIQVFIFPNLHPSSGKYWIY